MKVQSAEGENEPAPPEVRELNIPIIRNPWPGEPDDYFDLETLWSEADQKEFGIK